MKTILVTGSAGNLGKAVSQKFIGLDYRVIGTVTKAGGDNNGLPADTFQEVVVDLYDEEAAKQFVEKVVADYGTIEAAVLTVGGFVKGSVAESGMEAIRQQYKINFETAYNVAQPVF